MEDTKKYKIASAAQSVPEQLMDVEEALDWIDREIDFWKAMKVEGTQFNIAGRNIEIDLSRHYVNHWADVRSVFEDEGEFGSRIGETLAAAERSQFILSEGTQGKLLDELFARAKTIPANSVPTKNGYNLQTVLAAAALYSRHLSPHLVQDKTAFLQLDLLGLASRMNPISLQGHDGAKIAQSLDAAQSREQQVKKFLEDGSVKLQNLTGDLHRLEETYHQKLALEAPASYWDQISTDASKASWCWFLAFLAAVAIPLATVLFRWGAIQSNLEEFLGTSGLGGAALLSILGLGYGWTLKHLSRGFIQNLQISNDARQRKIMVMTYLGLSKDANVEIGESERALILNALFRPAPPSTGDEGPPIGLVELIRK